MYFTQAMNLARAVWVSSGSPKGPGSDCRSALSPNGDRALLQSEPGTYLRRYSSAEKDQWNEVIASSPATHFHFHRSYMDYHSDRFLDHSLLFFENGKLLGVLPANEERDTAKVWSHQGLTYGGCVWKSDVTQSKIIAFWELMATYYRQQGFQKLIYKALPFIYHQRVAQDDLYAIFHFGGQILKIEPNTVIDFLTPVKPSHSKKYGANVGRKAGLQIEFSNQLDRFFEILTQRLEEKYEVRPTHSLSELQLLHSLFPENIKLLGSFYDGEMIAAALLFDSGRVLHTQYLATTPEARKLRALDQLIIDGIFPQMKDRRYLSFGISTEDGGRYLNSGLIQQKEEFGGHTLAHLTFEMDLAKWSIR
ncbi:MAG: GNAT family N-acetyltransferase [Bdellovibrio sp.]|nr:MAG: GNAT family N-acetyltransferase [Bdellovibrio sp.]